MGLLNILQSLLNYRHYSTFEWDAVCRLRKSVFWSVFALHTCCVSARHRRLNGDVGRILQGAKSGSRWVLNLDRREDEGDQFSSFLPLFAFVRRLVCGLWRCHCRNRTTFIFLFGRTLRIRFLTSLVTVHIALNWLWQFSPRIPLIRFLHSSWICCRAWSATAGLSAISFSPL